MTERLILRKFEEYDYSSYCRLLGDPDVMEYSLGIKEPRQVKSWLVECIRKDGLHLTMTLKDSGEFIGYCILSGDAEETELGYRLLPKFWKKGYGREAVKCVLEYAKNTMKLHKIVAAIDPQNRASMSLAESLGFKCIGTKMLPEFDHPDYLYQIEWPDSP